MPYLVLNYFLNPTISSNVMFLGFSAPNSLPKLSCQPKWISKSTLIILSHVKNYIGTAHSELLQFITIGA